VGLLGAQPPLDFCHPSTLLVSPPISRKPQDSPPFHPASTMRLRLLWLVFFTQASHVSATYAEFSWFVLAAQPLVTILSRPDSVSGSRAPALVVAADWGSGDAPLLGNAVVRFEFLLFGDKDLGTFHTPRPCALGNLTSFGTGAQLPVDCVDPGCSGARCVYRIALAHERNSGLSYTLQVCVWGLRA
jgi:hypothetical protein